MNEIIAEEKRKTKEARERVAVFLRSIGSQDAQMIHSSFAAIENDYYKGGGYSAAFLGVLRVPLISDLAKATFVDIWIQHGAHIRQETRNQIALFNALPKLLPRYNGRDEITIFRGEGALNRKRRSYGASWSSDIEVADSFARDYWRDHTGGSVLLRTVVPPEAIIFMTNEAGESEYVVDRRKLKRIEVIRRYPELSWDKASQEAAH
ncbi:hypothetical protein [Rhizobium sp. RU35A]|uniref:hypothetical protein n=1 Tax=Rhizobium sp. RU35A TaxID=1907414 RepID=UPI00122C5B56|nr:hypothetical protein [Rhizobium sp. RU35A]